EVRRTRVDPVDRELDRAVEPIERTGAHLGGEDRERDAGDDRRAEQRERARGQRAQPRPDPPQHRAAAGRARHHGSGPVSPPTGRPGGRRWWAGTPGGRGRVPLAISNRTIRSGSASRSAPVTTPRGRKHTAPPAPASAGSSSVRPPPRSTIV